MNRRTFLRRTVGAIAAAAVAPLVPSAVRPLFPAPLTFGGVPVVVSALCPNNVIYFVASDRQREFYNSLVKNDRRYEVVCG